MIKSFNPVLREYTLLENASMNFCPSCGKQLPKSLGDEWLTILRKEYGVIGEAASVWNPMVPEEFKSDAWWKKRNL
ncbi:MAG: DUF6980 family protein [Gaiellaceae bacterium]